MYSAHFCIHGSFDDDASNDYSLLEIMMVCINDGKLPAA
jgi:hypothetical protein